MWSFHSRPDLGPAAAVVTTQAHDTALGYVFLAIKEGAGEHGPMMLDDRGRPVWFGKHPSARHFKAQRYRGRPILTCWEGAVVQGHGEGEYVIFDDSYREIARVLAGNGYRGDLHEFIITPQDTALLTAYIPMRTDLSSMGGPGDSAGTCTSSSSSPKTPRYVALVALAPVPTSLPRPRIGRHS